MTNRNTPDPLRSGKVDPDPLRQFRQWLQEAEQAKIDMPIAMTLATANVAGVPSARIVLLRGVDERGFLFFTNYESRKGQDLFENPQAALVFYWGALSRQVRIEGLVEKLTAEESDSYFSGRPRGHQLGAHASAQSRLVSGREELDGRFREMADKFSGQQVPRPDHWGGYRVVPERIEFWQEGESRIHDRLRYRRDASAAWLVERLAP